MAYELIYYPKCSTCVKGLALLNENNIEPVIIDYMKTGLSIDELRSLSLKTGSVKSLIREKTARELGIELVQSDETLLKEISNNLALLQRPILIKDANAVVGRPIEEMLRLKDA